jgi:two-component system chemotaxis response regulator CheY
MMPLNSKFLIVDDNPSDRLVVRAVLLKLGYKEVQEAEDGSIAEGKIENAVAIGAPFAIAIIDWQMPKINGFKLLKSIRRATKTKNTRVIAMTATANHNTVKEAIEGGADDFIVKPVTLELLKIKIENLSA